METIVLGNSELIVMFSDQCIIPIYAEIVLKIGIYLDVLNLFRFEVK